MESHLPEYIQSIIKIAPCAMAVADTTLRYVGVSEKWTKQFGLGEYLPGTPHNAFFPETDGRLAVMYQDGLQGKISRAEGNNVFPDGSVQYLKWEVQPLYNGKNEVGGLVIYVNGLTAGRTREQALKKSLDRYEQVNKMARVGVWEVDVPTGKIYWSAVIRQILGVPGDYEPTRESTADFFSAGTDRESSLKHYNAALEKGIPYNLELEMVTAEGKRLWVRARGDAEFKDGKCVRIFGSLQDIQSEREQRAQLLNSEIKYRSTIENSLYGVLLTIPGHHVIEANQAALSMFGYNLEELRKVERDQIFDVNDPALQDFMDRRARDGRARAEVTGIRKNGEHFPCEISAAMFDDIEGKKLNSLVIIDISERRQAEEKIRLSQEQFREAFEYSATGMALFGLDGKWKRVNRQLCDMLGYTEEELMQLKFQDITHPDDVDRNLDLLRNLIEGNGNGYQLEKRYIHKNGCVIWVLLGVSLIRDAHHQPLHCISQIQDITKTKEAEYALAVSEEKYRKIFENIQDIYYRTDVNGIITEISPSVVKILQLQT